MAAPIPASKKSRFLMSMIPPQKRTRPCGARQVLGKAAANGRGYPRPPLSSPTSVGLERDVEEEGLAQRVIGRREGNVAVGGAAKDRRADIEDIVDAAIEPDLVGQVVAGRQVEEMEIRKDGIGQRGE